MHVVVPEGWADPSRPSGGNEYDQRVCAGLRDRGWTVLTREVAGRWPGPDSASRAALTSALAAIPDGALVLLDGLVASAHPEVLLPEGRRVRIVVLVHLPLGCGADADGQTNAEVRTRERAVLLSAAGVVATSRWARDWLLTAYGLAPERLRAVTPGAQPARLASGTARGDRLLCVGAVTPAKGQDVLVAGLAEIAGLEWTCHVIGSLRGDPVFAAGLRERSREAGLGDRLVFSGPRTRTELDELYAAADLVAVPSRIETYGMVVTEALARGLPVVASDVGGVPEALGVAPSGQRPGHLVAAESPAELAAALRRWLTDAGWRDALRRAARERRDWLSDWSVTTDGLARVLSQVAAE